MFFKRKHMKVMFKKTLIACLMSTTIMTHVKPISETTAHLGAIAGGLIAGGATGIGTYSLAFDNRSNQNIRKIVSILSGAAAGGLTWYLVHKWLYSMTPPGRFATAQAIIFNVSFDSLIAREYRTEQDLFSHVTARFGTSWPLVIARERYMSMSSGLLEARSLLNSAYQEAQNNPSYTSLCAQCQQLQQKISDIAPIIENRLTVITKNEKYDLQTQLFERHMEEERHRQHEQHLQYQALAHDSYQREADRKNERQRDENRYQHQQNILNQNYNRPVTLNVG
jgi:hypothetical protein